MMIRHYKRFQVTGSESGSGKSWTETGICREDQDPLKIALARNNDLQKCSRFSVQEEHAFEELTDEDNRDEKRVRRELRGLEAGYRNLTNRWNDPEYCW